MALKELVGRAQGVLGPIEGEDLGITLPHEHLVVDAKALFCEPEGASDKGLAYQPVGWKNLSWLRYHPFENLDNLRLFDEQQTVDELALFQKAGGRTVVDFSNHGLGRDHKALARIARATGLNVIMGSGYYTAPSLSPEVLARSEEEMADEIVRDIAEGAEDTGIRAGIIGEVGCSWPLQEFERRSLRAAAKAQQQTGAAINVHPGRGGESCPEIVRVLDEAGADLSRVVLSHIDARVRDHAGRSSLARAGCYLEYDLWGWEGHFPPYLTPDGFLDLPNDTQRIYEILQLADEGYLGQILISHDIVVKTKLVCYGGWGYAHISNYAAPMMLKRGVTPGQLNTLMVENPRRLLCFV